MAERALVDRLKVTATEGRAVALAHVALGLARQDDPATRGRALGHFNTALGVMDVAEVHKRDPIYRRTVNRAQDLLTAMHQAGEIDFEPADVFMENEDGEVEIERRCAEPIKRRPPSYPGAAEARGVTGVAVVKYDIMANGSVENPKLAYAVPEGFFERAALRAVENWRYAQGLPCSDWHVQFVFRLRG
ncbi:MAG: TonB family protein [Maricaulaceae bacterium]